VSVAEEAPPPPKSRITEYAEILNPRFWNETFNRADRMLEYLCTLVRATGLQSTGWDSHQESMALLEDFNRLGELGSVASRKSGLLR
jgi:hypothetical protein